MSSLIAEVREFNRFYTATIGVLQDGLLSWPASPPTGWSSVPGRPLTGGAR